MAISLCNILLLNKSTMYEDFSRSPIFPNPKKLTPQNLQLFSEAHGNLDLKFVLADEQIKNVITQCIGVFVREINITSNV